MNSMEVVLIVGLVYASLKYWNNKLGNGYGIGNNNRAFGIFQGAQIISIFGLVYVGLDPQNSLYMEECTLTGYGAKDYWSLIGVELVLFIAVYILANLISHLVFKLSRKAEIGLYVELKNDNVASAMVYSVLMIITSISISYFVLKPFLFDWVSRNAPLIPLS